MNAIRRNRSIRVATVAAVAAFVASCAPAPVKSPGAAEARAELTRLQSDPALAPLAQDAIRDAEVAVQSAEETGLEPEIGQHRVYMADRKVATARALAEARYAEDQRQALVAERDRARLQARTAEAASARMEADAARSAAASAQQQAVALQQQIEAMHAQQTDRGLVMTLGDVLFETGRSELKTGSVMDLGRLATFLQQQPDRTVTIEGHTDSVGGEAANVDLSQRRADAVKAYLVSQGIDPARVRTAGLGEAAPVATNDTAAGRQQNRRVEIVISNPAAGM